MTKAANLLTRSVLTAMLGIGGSGCGSDSDSAGSPAEGTGTGGAASGGVSASTGGSDAAGGNVASGGSTDANGSPATGGASDAGGSVASGGAVDTGASSPTGGSTARGGAAPGGGRATGGNPGRGGSSTTGGAGTGDDGATGGTPASGGRGGSRAGSGGAAAGGADTSGGATGDGDTGGSDASGDGGSSSAGSPGGCTMEGTWPEADPSETGPFATTVENDVGPEAGVASADDSTPVQFTLYRPEDMEQGGLCHPVITWGDGHGTTPSMYGNLLTRLASHGFVVIASNSSAVSQGNPPPMLVGVTWVLEQNEDPASALYQRIDPTHIGATGHSEGAMATATAGADSNIVTITPICGGSNVRNLHGPALLLCGGQDTTLPCDGSLSALQSITTQPAMVGNYLTATHGGWLTRGNSAPHPMEVATIAWMRVQLMGDTSLRSMFYGPSCTLCTDSAWEITQNDLMNE